MKHRKPTPAATPPATVADLKASVRQAHGLYCSAVNQANPGRDRLVAARSLSQLAERMSATARAIGTPAVHEAASITARLARRGEVGSTQYTPPPAPPRRARKLTGGAMLAQPARGRHG